MFVVLVDFNVEALHQQQALNRLLEDAEAIRAMAGCRTFRPYCDPRNNTHVGVVHEWDGEAAFNTYLASKSFAELGLSLRPLMTSAPSSRRYDAALLIADA
ncbi:putative quinol monooxygenase [Labrenzia sp. PHM005]|uniref:putative quinol monooxygenase n=1 Tax=Labrenzia sp. PHM005 TaxID=2590016 RepID=UPI0011407317|nr:antibiotic biosynthesis monooxygenase [Labrenzia sp. PHM005]QDG76900.1 antibiotic biosynthesis monooxygenase [Labrenzia sp. PHM005]